MPTELETIDEQLKILQQQFIDCMGTVCEVFSRIVGYYRATKNWNTGKAQEFKERTTFTMPEETT
jgi:anaerobic ribonucleoside-triphosphate reductase